MKNCKTILIITIICLLVEIALSGCMSGCLSCDNPQTCNNCAPGQSCCPANCLKCINSTLCYNCSPGFTLNTAQNVCMLDVSASDPNCENAYQGHCISCKAGFYKSSLSNTCVQCQIVNCIICSSATICLKCSPNTYYNTTSNLCLGCMLNCQTCISPTQCTACLQTFYYNTTAQQCQQCTPNCTACINSTVCSSCQNGFYLNGGACSQCQYPCTRCVQTSTTCTACQKYTYFLINSGCSLCNATMPDCQICSYGNNELQCYACTQGKGLNPSKTACVSCMENCLQCNDEQTCIDCQVGYYQLTQFSECLQCGTSNCKTCDQNTCYQCMAEYFLVGNQCLICSDNCAVCQQYTCVQCEKGYYLNGTQCLPCYNQCSTCLLNATNCFSCLPGSFFFNLSNSCVSCNFPCIQCVSSTQCTKCSTKDGYSLNRTSNQCYNFTCPIQNCAICQRENCYNCNAGFYVSNNTCLACEQNCYSCSQSLGCSNCVDFYYLDDQNICQSCPKNCKDCTMLNGTMICNVCGAGTVLIQNSCKSCPNNCYTCSDTSTCIQCSVQYYLYAKSSSQVCKNCPTGCYTCNIMNPLQYLVCTKCQFGYVMNGYQCVSCPSNCKVCSDPNTCMNCFSQYTLVEYACQSCPAHCQTCHNQTFQCIDCMQGYSLSAILSEVPQCLKCSSYVPFCQSCDEMMICYGCMQQYQLTQNTQTSQYSCQKQNPSNGMQIAVIVLFVISIIFFVAGFIFFLFSCCKKQPADLQNNAYIQMGQNIRS